MNGKKDPDSYRQMLQHVIQRGVTFFNTADTYGDLAEELLGEVVPTKVGIRAGSAAGLSRPAVLRACEASLPRMGTDIIDLYQVHYDDPRTPVNETIAALDELFQAGKIRAYGMGASAARAHPLLPWQPGGSFPGNSSCLR